MADRSMKLRAERWVRRRFFAWSVLALLTWTAALPAAGQQRKLDTLLEGNPQLAKVASALLDVRRLARQRMTTQRMQQAVPAVPFSGALPEIEVRLRTLT